MADPVKMVVSRGSAQGRLVKLNDAEKAQKLIDKEEHEAKQNAPYIPSETEILMKAIEDKSGITQADKDASRQALIDAKA